MGRLSRIPRTLFCGRFARRQSHDEPMRSILDGPHLVLTVDYRFHLQALVLSGVCKVLLDSLFTIYNNHRVSGGEATCVTSVLACLTALRSSGSISRSTYDPTKCTVVGIFEATLSPCPVSMLPVLVGSSSSSVTTLRWGAGYGIMGCSLNYSIHGTEDSIVRDAAVASAVLVSFTSAALCRSCVQSWWRC